MKLNEISKLYKKARKSKSEYTIPFVVAYLLCLLDGHVPNYWEDNGDADFRHRRCLRCGRIQFRTRGKNSRWEQHD